MSTIPPGLPAPGVWGQPRLRQAPGQLQIIHYLCIVKQKERL